MSADMMNQPTIQIINGTILLPDKLIENGTILISGDTIAEITTRTTEIPGTTVIDARGNYVAPGCIDIHIHGGGG
ncbi:MAG: hypothetical protein LUJ25_04355 [Firmicutes bacterium]|nr:hypothetical protein [Bacillota bacterium]